MMNHCPTCTQPDYSPYRTYDARGKVTAGCVDDCHTGRLQPISESNRWHHRPAAKTIRRIANLCRQYGYDRSRWPASVQAKEKA